MILNNFFYTLKPMIPRRMQIFIRRHIAEYKRKKNGLRWPIDPDVGTAPDNWKGWPDSKRFAVVLSHDVDTQKGHDHVLDLIHMEKRLGFRSAINFVPERYTVSKELIRQVKDEGFEVCIHGLKHDGKLFKSKKIFKKGAQRINQYMADWQSIGFTAPSMICNLDWIHDLNIEHSTCTFDTDPFEPAPNYSGTIFPFTVTDPVSGHSFIELPYTLPQDHALFIILQEKNIDIWKKKLDWIVERGGMALLNTHPDYMRFEAGRCGPEEYPKQMYEDLLTYIRETYDDQFWKALPSEVADFWRKRNRLATDPHGQRSGK